MSTGNTSIAAFNVGGQPQESHEELEQRRALIRDILEKYASPDPAIVSQLPKKNKDGSTTYLGYIGHAQITKILCEIDPLWSWEPAEWFEGRPRIHYHESVFQFRNGEEKRSRTAVMWGFITIHGKRLPCVGSCSADKEEIDKELSGDLLRNGCMRFCVGVNLWGKDSDNKGPSPQKARPQKAPKQEQPARPAPAAPSMERAPETDIFAIKSLIDALPESDRKSCKNEFVMRFGLPDNLAAEHVEEAYKLIDVYNPEAPF